MTRLAIAARKNGRDRNAGLTVDVQRGYPGFQLSVNFSAEGGPLGLLGASGSGKSMTLRCIAGLERPDAGRIVLNGRVLFDAGARINVPPAQRRTGVVFQDYALVPAPHGRTEHRLRPLRAAHGKTERADPVLGATGCRSTDCWPATPPACLSQESSDLRRPGFSPGFSLLMLAESLLNAPAVLSLDLHRLENALLPFVIATNP